MGIYLAFVDAVQGNGEPAENAKWLQTNVKTSYVYQFEEKAAALGLKFEYPKNGTRAALMQLVMYAKYLHVLHDIYGPDLYEGKDSFFEAQEMTDFVAEHGNEIEAGTWFWHQG